MNTLALKKEIHTAVDLIENEQLLETIYYFLLKRENKDHGTFWTSLTEDQKEEILSAFEESEDDENLIDSEEIFSKKK